MAGRRRFRLAPRGGIQPCHTANAAHVLCRLGHASDPRLTRTFEHLLSTRHTDGGWRCSKFPYGRVPGTEFSNPLVTLTVLDALRLRDGAPDGEDVDGAVDSLLEHWTTRVPVGPCQYGIGTLFGQVEYPMRGYNLFRYVHVLSFYDRAREDGRFAAALAALEDRLVDGRVVVERVVPRLAGLEFCRKGEPSEPATARFHEILANVGRDAA